MERKIIELDAKWVPFKITTTTNAPLYSKDSIYSDVHICVL